MLQETESIVLNECPSVTNHLLQENAHNGLKTLEGDGREWNLDRKRRGIKINQKGAYPEQTTKTMHVHTAEFAIEQVVRMPLHRNDVASRAEWRLGSVSGGINAVISQ